MFIAVFGAFEAVQTLKVNMVHNRTHFTAIVFVHQAPRPATMFSLVVCFFTH